VPARRRDQLERLVRPPLALDRLTESMGGQLLYQLRRPWRDGATALLLDPVELLERLAALVPPPRRPLVAYRGLLAPHARWRSAIVPIPGRPCQAAPPRPRSLLRSKLGFCLISQCRECLRDRMTSGGWYVGGLALWDASENPRFQNKHRISCRGRCVQAMEVPLFFLRGRGNRDTTRGPRRSSISGIFLCDVDFAGARSTMGQMNISCVSRPRGGRNLFCGNPLEENL
jgi:hypothetical protein